MICLSVIFIQQTLNNIDKPFLFNLTSLELRVFKLIFKVPLVSVYLYYDSRTSHGCLTSVRATTSAI